MKKGQTYKTSFLVTSSTVPLCDPSAPEQVSQAALALRARLPWLDPSTAALLAAVTADLAREHSQVQALILLGSVARHEERPLGSPHPSDVDLLVLLQPQGSDASGASGAAPTSKMHRVSLDTKLAVHHTVGERAYHHPTPALELQTILADIALADWDPTFRAHVARDGILLWARPAAALPAILSPVAARGPVFHTPSSPRSP